MTTVYFVRHAQPDYDHKDNRTRPLTAKGLRDRELVTRYLLDKGVTLIASSPYKRAVDTVDDLAGRLGLEIVLDEGFAERTVTDGWIEDYHAYTERQWADFSHKLSKGESLGETQARNIEALERLLSAHEGGTVVIGSHGAALSTVINHYDKTFGHGDFLSILDRMPWITEFVFDGKELVRWASIDLMEAATNT